VITISRSLGLCIACACIVIALFGLPEVLRGPQINTIVDPKLKADAVAAALQKLDLAKIKALQEREISTLIREPFSSSSLKNLVLLSSLGLDNKVKEQLALQISKFSKRNIAAQVETVNILLRRRQFVDALIEADALLRAHPQMSKVVFPALQGLITDKDGLAALANVMEGDPPWRAELFMFVIKSDPDGNTPLAIIAAMQKVKALVRTEELNWLISSLIVAKKTDKAYFIWLDSLPSEDLRYVERVFDGGFDREPKNLYFDWTIVPRQNARISVDFRHATVRNRMLSIDFFGDKGYFSNVFQYLQVAPGRYVASFEHMAQNLQTEQGMVWTVTCENGPVVGRSQPMRNNTAWATLSFPIDIPDGGCTTQILKLESASAAELDTLITGQLYFDSVQIVPFEEAENKAPN
jgi:hypothetical protein